MPTLTEMMAEQGLPKLETGIGWLLNSLGLNRERLTDILSKPFFSVGPEIPGEREKLRPLAEFATGMIPYEMDLNNPMTFMTQIKPVYHGSPYKFNKFENKAIGTGEGAQAFGYGHYLTESKAVAKSYAQPRSDRPVVIMSEGKEIDVGGTARNLVHGE